MFKCSECGETFDEPDKEIWSDPGDYPSGAGGSPLPSYEYDACPYCGSTEFSTYEEDDDDTSV